MNKSSKQLSLEMAKHEDSAQEFLAIYGALEGIPVFDANDDEASQVFAGAITFASRVFGNRLVLGHCDYRKEDKLAIIEHLKGIIDILQK